MKYYNRNTGRLIASSCEELMEYYKRTYKENLEGGYIDCSIEEWIESDTDTYSEGDEK